MRSSPGFEPFQRSNKAARHRRRWIPQRNDMRSRDGILASLSSTSLAELRRLAAQCQPPEQAQLKRWKPSSSCASCVMWAAWQPSDFPARALKWRLTARARACRSPPRIGVGIGILVLRLVGVRMIAAAAAEREALSGRKTTAESHEAGRDEYSHARLTARA
jgi:hypothetical protein